MIANCLNILDTYSTKTLAVEDTISQLKTVPQECYSIVDKYILHNSHRFIDDTITYDRLVDDSKVLRYIIGTDNLFSIDFSRYISTLLLSLLISCFLLPSTMKMIGINKLLNIRMRRRVLEMIKLLN
jgi:hypothetical protein